MRKSRIHTTRVVGMLLCIALLTLMGTMALAQNEPEHPENGVVRRGDDAAGAAHDEATRPQAPDEEVILYRNIAGQSFHPRESSTTVQYSGGGCLNRTSPSGFVTSDLQLPDGAEIQAIRVFVYDNNADQDLDFYLYSYEGQGDFEQLAIASSSGTPEYTSLDIEPFGHIVDNATESLGLVVGMDAASDSTIRLCGMRVQYSVDIPTLTLLPAILKDYVGGG